MPSPPAGACVYLGCKVTDGVRYAGQLSHMMSTLLSANICTSMVRAVLLCYKRGGGVRVSQRDMV